MQLLSMPEHPQLTCMLIMLALLLLPLPTLPILKTHAFTLAFTDARHPCPLPCSFQAQHMVVDMLALGVSASAMYLAKNIPKPALLPLMAFPALAVGDLYSIYRELKAVELRTLNRERAEMIVERWVAKGAVPNAAEVGCVCLVH